MCSLTDLVRLFYRAQDELGAGAADDEPILLSCAFAIWSMLAGSGA